MWPSPKYKKGGDREKDGGVAEDDPADSVAMDRSTNRSASPSPPSSGPSSFNRDASRPHGALSYGSPTRAPGGFGGRADADAPTRTPATRGDAGAARHHARHPSAAFSESEPGEEGESDASEDGSDDGDDMDVLGTAGKIGLGANDDGVSSATSNEKMRLFDLAVRMSTEIEVREHRRHMKRYKACFTGREAVRFLLTNRIARDTRDAVAIGRQLHKAGLLGPIRRSRQFANRSFLYRFNDAMTPGVQAARWTLANEMSKMQGRVKDVCAVVETHTAATHAISSEHAVAMSRVEQVYTEMRGQLARTKAATFVLAFACFGLAAVDLSGGGDGDGAGLGYFSRTKFTSAPGVVDRAWAARVAIAIVAAALSTLAAWLVTDRKSLDTVLYTRDWLEDGELAGELLGDDGDGGAADLMSPGRRVGKTPGGMKQGAPPRGKAAGGVKAGGDRDARTESSFVRRISLGGIGEAGDGASPSSIKRLGSIHRWFSRGGGGGAPGGPAAELARRLRPEDRALPPPAADSAIFANEAQAPVGIRLSPERPMQWLPEGENRPEDGVTCPAQTPFPFETELFKGKAIINLRGLQNTPARVFKGKARYIQVSVQGRFKRPVAMDDLQMGISLPRPLRRLPTRWLLNLCTRVIRTLGAKYGLEITDPAAPKPYAAAPVITCADAIACNAPGEEPDVSLPPVEDTRRVPWLRDTSSDASTIGGCLTAPERRKKIAKVMRDARKSRGKEVRDEEAAMNKARSSRTGPHTTPSAW